MESNCIFTGIAQDDIAGDCGCCPFQKECWEISDIIQASQQLIPQSGCVPAPSILLTIN